MTANIDKKDNNILNIISTTVQNKLSERYNPVLQDYEAHLHKKLKDAHKDPYYKELKKRETEAELRATIATVRHAKSDSKSAKNETQFKTLAARLKDMAPVDGDSSASFEAGKKAGKLKDKIDRMGPKIPGKLAKSMDYQFPELKTKTGKTKKPGRSEGSSRGFRTKSDKEYELQKGIADSSRKSASDFIKSHVDKLSAFKKGSKTGDMPLDIAIDISRFALKQKPESKKSTIPNLSGYVPSKNDKF